MPSPIQPAQLQLESPSLSYSSSAPIETEPSTANSNEDLVQGQLLPSTSPNGNASDEPFGPVRTTIKKRRSSVSGDSSGSDISMVFSPRKKLKKSIDLKSGK